MPYSSIAQKRISQAAFTKRRRDDFIASRGGACEVCRSREGLEVDHIDRSTKKYNPRDIWNRRAEVRLAELSKCQVLCSDCHRAKTKREFSGPEHGTQRTYSIHGCRCQECTNAHRDSARQWRAAVREKSA